MEDVGAELKEKALVTKPTYSCLQFAVNLLEIPNKGVMRAKDYPVNSQTPEVGAIAITYESWLGHASVVTEVYSDTVFEVVETNYVRNTRGVRVIDRNKVKTKGFYIVGL